MPGVLALDHVIVAVADLDEAARRYDEQHGLTALAGGRHAGHGTGNRIVPLGGSYIELMGVVDREEAAASPLGSWLGRRLEEIGEGPAALCLRVIRQGFAPTPPRLPATLSSTPGTQRAR